MRLVICIALSIFVLGAVQGQKVKYKKGIISIDKVKKYEVVKTKKKGIGEPRTFTLKTLDGSELLIVKDSTLVFSKLPNETKEMVYQHVQYIEAPGLAAKSTVPQIAALNFGKKLSKDLEELGFFKEEGLTKEIFDQYVASHDAESIPEAVRYIDSMNVIRKDNHTRTVKMFGDLPQRKPGKLIVRDGQITQALITVGKFKLSKKGSYASVYQIIDNSGNILGKFVDIPSDGRANIQMLVNSEIEEKRLDWIYFKSTRQTPIWSMDQKMTKAAEYIIRNGFL